MTHILFVDDQRHVLDGLRDRLRRRRHQWQMTFVDSGQQALEVLREQPVDVVVSDLRMPGMDGASLLHQVRDQYPDVVRIVLSGQADTETAARAACVAQQFLAKPADPGVIEQVVERTVTWQSLVAGSGIRAVVGRISHLPAAPRVHAELQVALADEVVTSRRVAAVIEREPAIAAKALQLVNSAFFGLSRPIVEIEQAVVYLGFETIRQVVLAVEVFEPQGRRADGGAIDLDALRRHALDVARLATQLVSDGPAQREAFIAGLLHDIGKLVLASGLPERYLAAQRDAARLGCPLHEAERAAFGTTHAEAGGYLLGLWGLPAATIESVAHHHDPRRSGVAEFGPLAATHVADVLINERDALRARRACVAVADGEFLQWVGVADRLDDWRTLARASAHAD